MQIDSIHIYLILSLTLLITFRKARTTLILPPTHLHVGHDVSQSQEPDQCVIVFYDDL